MICIFSDKRDYSTTEVMRWLHHLGAEVIRVNCDDEAISEISLTHNSFFFLAQGKRIAISDLDAAWYRKGRSWLGNSCSVPPTGSDKFQLYLRTKLRLEGMCLSEFLHDQIRKRVPVLGRHDQADLNKLQVMLEAKHVGLHVPDFIVTSSRSCLCDFLNSYPKIITKPLSDCCYLFDHDEGKGYFSYTEAVTPELFNDMPPIFSASLFQRQIEKSLEIRTFVIGRQCFSMAILSQTDPQTRVDYRKYNHEKPNRTVPFSLPIEIESKVLELLSRLSLNTGSIDMIKGVDGSFYFLEVNPTGQFGMMSRQCNYNLEKKVAENLILLASASPQMVRDKSGGLSTSCLL